MRRRTLPRWRGRWALAPSPPPHPPHGCVTSAGGSGRSTVGRGVQESNATEAIDEPATCNGGSKEPTAAEVRACLPAPCRASQPVHEGVRSPCPSSEDARGRRVPRPQPKVVLAVEKRPARRLR